MTLQPIKIFADSLGGEALWQNAKFITPNKMRGKAMGNFLKKREEKLAKKREKMLLLKEGQDGDAYLDNAFE